MVREQLQPDRDYWRLPMMSLIPDESLQRLQEQFGKKFNSFNKLEVQALVTADLEGLVDNARLRQISGEHASEMTRILQGLVAKGALTQEGQGRWSRYQISNSIHKPWGPYIRRLGPYITKIAPNIVMIPRPN